jgi:hypothetical protein
MLLILKVDFDNLLILVCRHVVDAHCAQCTVPVFITYYLAHTMNNFTKNCKSKKNVHNNQLYIIVIIIIIYT